MARDRDAALQQGNCRPLVQRKRAAAASGRYLSAYLFGVTPSDIATYAAAAAALGTVAALACAVPAWRASRIDAIDALRR